MNPIRAVLRSKRDIEYHSARSTRTPWTRAMGWCFLLSLLAGLPCALLADSFIVRERSLASIEGRLFIDDHGRLDGFSLHVDLVPEGWEQPRPYGELVVTVKDKAWGWPSATREAVASTRLKVTHFDPARANPAEEKVVIRRIIDRALLLRTDTDRALILAALDGAKNNEDRPPLRLWPLAFNALVAWPILYAIGSVMIFLAWVRHSLWQHQRTVRRRALRARGLCPACRHRVDSDLWSAKCPECGEPLY